MKLKIENFAKIKQADIKLDGITVIAGLNDTGKSTIGKVLCSVFNSLYSIDKNVSGQRRRDIGNICYEITDGIYHGNKVQLDKNAGNWMIVADNLCKKIMGYEGNLTIDQYQKLILQELKCTAKDVEDYIESSYNKIAIIKNTPDIKLFKEVTQRLFSNVFSTQMNNCYSPEKEAGINLTIKEKDIKIGFQYNECITLDMPIRIMHEAFFIDDPFVLDNAGRRGFRTSYNLRDSLIEKIVYPQVNLMDGIFDAVVSKENLKEIYDAFNKVVDGEIRNSRDGIEYIAQGQEEGVAVSNLSAGVKGFVLVKTLIEKGILKEKDILILDEPEVHMHTQWQLVYAEIIVLLQKNFDMTILVTTHSSHFLQAIEYYSKKYHLQDKCNYYMSKKTADGVVFDDVTNDTGKIHSEMVEPSILLDRLEEELEYGDEE